MNPSPTDAHEQDEPSNKKPQIGRREIGGPLSRRGAVDAPRDRGTALDQNAIAGAQADHPTGVGDARSAGSKQHLPDPDCDGASAPGRDVRAQDGRGPLAAYWLSSPDSNR